MTKEREEKLMALANEIKSYTKKILDFKNDFVPGHRSPTKDGIYITICCGLPGIYQVLNEWKNGHWQLEYTDDSSIIAYSRDTITLKYVD